MRVAGGTQSPALVTAADLAPLAEPLLQGLFGAFELPASAENEYVMKCIMRSFSTLQESVIPYLATLLPVLTQKLQLAAKNPTKPHYNHYLVRMANVLCVNPFPVTSFEGSCYSLSIERDIFYLLFYFYLYLLIVRP